MHNSESTREPRPATTSRNIRLADGTVIPANTDTTAQDTVGNRPLVLVFFNGKSHLVPVTAVRYL